MKDRTGYRNTHLQWRVWPIVFVAVLLLLHNTGYGQALWVQKVVGSGLGNPFCVNPWNENIIYGAVGTSVLYISRDRGTTWRALSTVSGGSQIKSVTVSARDTNTILVAQEAGPPDRIMKSTNNGATWFPTLLKDFYFWGVPIVYSPQLNDDTVYTMGSNIIWRSTNFGSTWDSVCTNPFGITGNQGWEYAIIRPDSPNVLLVADNATGIWKSTDYGVKWRRTHVSVAEVPALAYVPATPTTIYGARWAGGGGLVKSTDGGETWSFSTPLNGINLWGVSVSKTNPNYLITGTFGPLFQTNGGIYISRDGGVSWERTYQGLSNILNYACLVMDTLSVFVLQGDGIWKLQRPFTSLELISPNGGEVWKVNSVQSITWSSSNVVNVRIEYTTNNGMSWNLVRSSTPAATGSFEWTIPNTASNECRIRVSDVLNSSIVDQSDSMFTILLPAVTVTRPNGGELWLAGSTELINWSAEAVTNVDVAYSLDDGLNWIPIASSVAADAGSFAWVVPHTTSSECRIRVKDATDPSIYDLSDGTFGILASLQFVCDLIVTGSNGMEDTLKFGAIPQATDGIDAILGEVELAPRPPVDTFDARWQVPGTLGLRIDFRDTASIRSPSRTYRLEVQPGSGGVPVTVRWQPEMLSQGSFIMRDLSIPGDTVQMNMLTDSLCVLTDSTLCLVEIVYDFLATLALPISQHWNMVSIPLSVEDGHLKTLFPSAQSSAFSYETTYYTEDTLRPGKAYWIRFGASELVSITGKPRLQDTLLVRNGWNMIGTLSVPIPVSTIQTDPPGIISSRYFGYQTGYVSVDVLEPGKGYWVKVRGSGKMILSVN